MSGISSLESLQELHRDLVALSEARLPTLERLALELEASIEDFKTLLDKQPRNNSSRNTLATGR